MVNFHASGTDDCDSNYGGSCGTCGTVACDGSCQGDSDCGAGCYCYNEVCDCGGGGGGGGCVDDYECGYGQFCDTSVYPAACEDQIEDPIIVDLTGQGFPMTAAPNGVKFDFFNNGKPVQSSWTQAGASVGWLAS